MEMIELIRTRDNRKVITAMIENQATSVWSNVRVSENDIDFEADAIKVSYPDSDWKMPVVRIERFLDTMLDIDDDFAQEVNEILYNLKKDDSEKVIEILNAKYDGEIDENGYGCSSGYTYNYDNYLSRDIVYHIFEYDGDRYAFIQVHYGADARVGFGAMVCFKIKDVDYFIMGMDITAYDSVTDEDYNVSDLDDIADYDKDTNTWTHKETGNEIYLNTPANGF